MLESLKNKSITIIGRIDKNADSHKLSTLISNWTSHVHTISIRTDSEQGDQPLFETLIEHKKRKIAEYDFIKIIADTDIIIMSPDIPSYAIHYIKNNNLISTKLCWSYLDLLSLPSNIRLVAITGTNGKSTTVRLLDSMLKNETDSYVYLGNNYYDILQNISHIDKNCNAIGVVEANAHQIECWKTINPHIAVILNLYHSSTELRYQDSEVYFNSKIRLISSLSKDSWSILNFDDPNIIKYKNKYPQNVFGLSMNNPLITGAYLSGDELIVAENNNIHFRTKLVDLPSRGPCDLYNWMASFAALYLQRLPDEAFHKSVAHGLQSVKFCDDRITTHGITIINDSQSENPLTLRNLPTCPENNIYLIVCALNDFHIREVFDTLDNVNAKSQVKCVFIIHSSHTEICCVETGECRVVPILCDSGEEGLCTAINHACESAVDGDYIVFSPTCKNQNLFKSKAVKREAFQNAIQQIMWNQ